MQLSKVLELAPGVLDGEGILIVQTRKKHELRPPGELVQEKEAQFGDTKVSFYRRVSR